MPQNKMAQHTISWDGDTPTVRCDGDRTSACHIFPDCECEVSTQTHLYEHPSVPHDNECWLLTWIKAIGPDDCWEGMGDMGLKPPRRDGVIIPRWSSDSECVLWNYQP